MSLVNSSIRSTVRRTRECRGAIGFIAVHSSSWVLGRDALRRFYNGAQSAGGRCPLQSRQMRIPASQFTSFLELAHGRSLAARGVSFAYTGSAARAAEARIASHGLRAMRPFGLLARTRALFRSNFDDIARALHANRSQSNILSSRRARLFSFFLATAPRFFHHLLGTAEARRGSLEYAPFRFAEKRAEWTDPRGSHAEEGK